MSGIRHDVLEDDTHSLLCSIFYNVGSNERVNVNPVPPDCPKEF